MRFKVGDKVRVRKGKGYDALLEGGIYVIEDICFEPRTYKLEGNGTQNWVWWAEERFEPANGDEIHIRIKGNKVIAVHTRDGVYVSSAKAICSPDDEFDFETGAILAFDRLMGREPAKPKDRPEWQRQIACNTCEHEHVGEGAFPCAECIHNRIPNPKDAWEPKRPAPTKFNFEDFRTGKIAVNCRTEDEAKRFLAYLHAKSLYWITGRFDKETEWYVYKERTCYSTVEKWGGARVVMFGDIARECDPNVIVIPFNYEDL